MSLQEKVDMHRRTAERCLRRANETGDAWWAERARIHYGIVRRLVGAS